MPSDNTGKTILSIQFQKKRFCLTFDDESTISLSERALAQFYVYPNKKLSEKEYLALKEAEELDPLHTYLTRLFQRGKYSEAMIRQKLYQRKAKRYQIEELLTHYRQYGLIDDESLVKEWIDYYREKHLGYRAIQQKLIAKGFTETLVESTVKPFNEAVHVTFIVNQLEKRLQTLPMRAKKQKLYALLQVKGFDHETIMHALDAINENDSDRVYHEAKRVYEQTLLRYRRRYEGKVLTEKVMRFMISKGYTKDMIENIRGEYHHGS